MRTCAAAHVECVWGITVDCKVTAGPLAGDASQKRRR